MFKVADGFLEVKGNANSIYLLNDSWDDFGYKTTFSVYIYKQTEYINLGSVKIGSYSVDKYTKESGYVVLPHEFESLDDNYFSLGQDVDF